VATEGGSTIDHQLRKGAWLRRSFTLSTTNYQLSGLLVNDLDLLVEHLAGKAIDRHARHAVALTKAGAPSNVVFLQ